MCGIAGWFLVFPNRPDHKKRILAMLQSIAHRGPDGSGSTVFEHAALGHVRLTIIDPDGGKQPMHDCERNLTISYNGEIYNYKSLRQSLGPLKWRPLIFLIGLISEQITALTYSNS